jgi:hypothetical protein
LLDARLGHVLNGYSIWPTRLAATAPVASRAPARVAEARAAMASLAACLDLPVISTAVASVTIGLAGSSRMSASATESRPGRPARSRHAYRATSTKLDQGEGLVKLSG